MTAQPDPVTVVREALARLSAALVSGRPDAVLAVEESLGAAARQLTAHRPAPGADRAQFAAAIREARVVLFTCQRLGRASADLMRATSAAGRYGSDGRMAPPAAPRTVVSRT